MKKAVIFDMDGTLFDTEPIYYKSNKEAFAEVDYDLTAEDYQPFIGVGSDYSRRGFGELLGDAELGSKVFDRADFLFNEMVNHQVPPLKAGVMDLLEHLNNQGIACYVASSSAYATIVDFTDRAGIAKYFKAYIGGDQVSEAKPDPEIFLKALDLTGHPAEEALVVEDSLNGVRASYSAYIDVIMVPDLIAPDDEVLDKCLAVVPRIDDIVPFLD